MEAASRRYNRSPNSSVSEKRASPPIWPRRLSKAGKPSYPLEASTPADLDQAMQAAREHRLSFWDAMLWATLRRIGVRVLISEDFQDGRILDGVRFVDPFAVRNANFIAQLLPS